MSNEAFRRIASKLNESFSNCPNSYTGYEDLDVAQCFRKIGVHGEKSIDEFGKERFHSLNLYHYYDFKLVPLWLFLMSVNPIKTVRFSLFSIAIRLSNHVLGFRLFLTRDRTVAVIQPYRFTM